MKINNGLINTLKENPALVKLMLLSQGVQDLKNVNSDKAQPNGYWYNLSNSVLGLPSEILLPEPRLGAPLSTSIYISYGSPWEIRENDGVLALYYLDNYIFNIDFTPKPKFTNELIDGKVLGLKVGGLYGGNSVALFIDGFCHYMNLGLGCNFCSLAVTREKEGRVNVYSVTPKLAAIIVDKAIEEFGENIKTVLYTSGTYPDLDKGIERQIDVIKAVKRVAPRVSHHLTTMPPRTPSLFDKLKSAGLTSISMGMEIVDPTLFRKLCPGKDKYFGQENFYHSFKEALYVFGRGNVFCGLVAGLDKLVTFKAGMQRLYEMDVTPAINIFHPDPRTPLEKLARPKLDYLWEMVSFQSKMLKIHTGLKPPVGFGGRRSSLDYEVHAGLFDMIGGLHNLIRNR